MIGQLILGNVFHRPLRTLISILAVGVEVALVILIVGLTSGMLQETAKRIEGVGADILLQPPSASVFLAFSGAPMPIRIGDRLRSLKYIQYVAPVLLQFNSTDGIEIIYGIEPESFNAVSGGFVFLQGHDIAGPDDVLMDDWAARSRNINVGATFKLLDHDFHVAGIVEHGKGARIFVPLATLQDLSGSRDKASIFFVKCTRPDRTDTVMDEMHAILPGYEVRPLKDFMSLMTSTALPGLNTFVNSMIALAVAIGFLVIFLSMYTTVIERTRDIGVLKSIGASNIYVVGLLLAETASICGVGVAIGVGMSYATRVLFLSTFPTLSILITPAWIIRAALIAAAGGLLGACYPAWLAGRKDVIEALAYD
jgi:putative ABC transport system permease protein